MGREDAEYDEDETEIDAEEVSEGEEGEEEEVEEGEQEEEGEASQIDYDLVKTPFDAIYSGAASLVSGILPKRTRRATRAGLLYLKNGTRAVLHTAWHVSAVVILMVIPVARAYGHNSLLKMQHLNAEMEIKRGVDERLTNPPAYKPTPDQYDVE